MKSYSKRPIEVVALNTSNKNTSRGLEEGKRVSDNMPASPNVRNFSNFGQRSESKKKVIPAMQQSYNNLNGGHLLVPNFLGEDQLPPISALIDEPFLERYFNLS